MYACDVTEYETNRLLELLVYVIAWFAVVFGINSTSNAEIIVRGEQQTMLPSINSIAL